MAIIKILKRLRGYITNRKLFTNGKDNIYNLATPLTIVLSLSAMFYVECKPISSRFRLNFFLLRHIPGWILLVNYYYQLLNQCSVYSKTCAFPIFLNIMFFPVCLLTERHLRDLFNALGDIDSCLRGLGVTRVINNRRQWLKLFALMALHLIWILSIGFKTKSEWKVSLVSLCIIGLAVQRRINFLWYQFLCDQLRERFRLIESVWTTDDPRTMEQVRLLYQRARETVDPLSKAFGPRLLFMIIDINLQCTRFFTFTFVFPTHEDGIFFALYFAYHYYCLHATTTASDNLEIQSRSLLNRLLHLSLYKMDEERRTQVEMLWLQIDSSPVEVSICGLFSYNRALLLRMMNGMVVVWALVAQTAPAVVNLLTNLQKGGLHN